MYKKEKPMALKTSSSAICNNLSIHVNLEKSIINYAVVHKAVVNLVGAFMDGSTVNHRQVVCKEPSAAHANSMIMQAKLLPFPGRSILVIASQKGIQMYEADGSVMLYWYAIDDNSNSTDAQATFARGICQIGTESICVGNHLGHILVFNIPSRGSNITLSETLKGHSSPICDLQSVDNKLISSDEMGNIILWQSGGDKCKQILKIPGSGYPCSSVGQFRDTVIGSYGSGHIRVFSADTGKIRAEVTAHARWITAMDIAPANGLVVTASEDTYVKVWQIKTGENTSVELLFSDSVTDIQLQGAKFITPEGKAIGLTGYDNNEIHFYRLS